MDFDDLHKKLKRAIIKSLNFNWLKGVIGGKQY
ncbi:Uncharacterised protein [Serratia plymuthica]|nr:Uncharacterised protein [Serratia plymuthica]